MQLNLSEEQTRVLRTVLQDYVSDVRMEIADTEDFKFREALKQRKQTVSEILNALGPEGAP